jgi:hypothetical protein
VEADLVLSSTEVAVIVTVAVELATYEPIVPLREHVPAVAPKVAVTTGSAFVEADRVADAPPVVPLTVQFTVFSVPPVM